MASFFSINGSIHNTGLHVEALVNDRGLAYGHGLFETVLLSDGKLPLFDRHLYRICSDAPKIGIFVKDQLIVDVIKQFTNHLSVNGMNNGIVKIMVTAGVGGRGYEAPDSPEPLIICTSSYLPDNLQDQRQQGISVRCCNYKLPNNQPLAGIKHLNRLDQVIARSEWNNENYGEGLLFNSENNLIEAISANIFIKNANGEWLTPDLSYAGINGVMRGLLIEKLFPDCGIAVKLAHIDFESLRTCQELFICNSIRGIIPINSIYNSIGDLVDTKAIGQQIFTLQTQLRKNYPHYK